MFTMDFLPVCDLLFNLVSVTAYFCDVAFASIVAYSLLVDERDLTWFFIIFLCTTASLLFCQILSLRWFVAEEEKEENINNADSKVPSSSGPSSAEKARTCPASWPWLVAVGVHFCMSGVLWRYARLLFLPIDMALVKREMRNLSILRMVHAFTQCLPCILAEGYLLATRGAAQSSASSVTAPMASPTVYRVAAALSLLNICWALASFSKHIRRRDIHRLTLTWIGVICQLLWHLGTVGARCLALVLYASVYHGWIFLFGFLHWACMLMWIIFQSKTKESSANRPTSSTMKTNVLLSYGYMVDFINLDDSSDPSSVAGGTTRFRMTLYYGIMAIENLLLVSLWSSSVQTSLLYTYEDRRDAFLAVILPFLAGLFFMAVYYRVFHVTRTMPFYLGQDYNIKQQKSPQQASASIYGSGNGAATGIACGASARTETRRPCSTAPSTRP